ncbi:MAG: PIG-L family deacetylase [Nanoarchaeota archaeon]|nr:PIG-L family deacetylase [Nanoarchaeota archaeon]
MIKKIIDNVYLKKRTLKKVIAQFKYVTDKNNLLSSIIANDSKIKNKKILVVAPHPDDEIFGCGGTIKKLSKQNHITCIYMTSGGPTLQKMEYPSPEIIEKEALKASEIIGINKTIFVKLENSKITFKKNDKKTMKKINKIIIEIKPNIIILPAFLENHLDHSATTQLIINSYLENYEAWFYGVHTPISLPTHIIDITKQINVKMNALQAYKKTLLKDPMPKAIISLNNYYGLTKIGKGWAEPFIIMNSTRARELIKRI